MKFNFEPSQEGTCLLYDGLTGRSIAGVNFQEKLYNLYNISAKNVMGYLAYPNPHLKNRIPDQLFFTYERLHPSQTPLMRPQGSYSTSGRLEQSVTKAQYLKKIHQIKELLAAGEVYQINYAIGFRKKFHGDSYALFYRLTKNSPAAFSAYLNCGDFQIVSASPERLFKIEANKIVTQPIKGTASKKGGPQALKKMFASEKEQAELDMITDLERNDLGRVCEYGTVCLAKNRAVMELPNLWHTYSEVQGKLRKNIRLPQILHALFPGGSITGCPKLRAMETIEKLEGLPRNIFTGSIGYMAGKTADFNIAIRTALIHRDTVEFWAGGGIVFNSNPQKEYAECMLKAEKFLALL